MIVEYKKSGQAIRIVIDDAHDWAEICDWICVKMGYTVRKSDPEFERILKAKIEREKK